MLQILLLFVFMSFSSSHNYAYHFIKDPKSWCEAQKYCRQYYTDLATAYDATDGEKINKAANGLDAWIGLHNNGSNIKEWHWSQPGVEYKEKGWERGRPLIDYYNCAVTVGNSFKWMDENCSNKLRFICYNVSSNTSVMMETNLNWLEAQQYCRQHHTDLISGLDRIQNYQPQNEQHCENKCWIGLFRDSWIWSDGSNSSWRNMADHVSVRETKCAKLTNQGNWMSEDCSDEHPFICYDDHFILVEEELTWEQARYHCRRHHRDLAWITDEHLDRGVRARAGMAPDGHDLVWVGLLHICFVEDWVWVTGDYVSEQDERWRDPGHNDCGDAGAMETGGENKWVKKRSEETHYFICATRC